MAITSGRSWRGAMSAITARKHSLIQPNHWYLQQSVLTKPRPRIQPELQPKMQTKAQRHTTHTALLQTMTSKDNLVSVVIPAYNAAAFIADTLSSMLAQTYAHLEILVVDDGSCDRTPDIVKAVARQDTRVRLLQQPNAGVAAARNFGIQNACGEFVAPIDADDLWHPEAMSKLVSQFQKSPQQVGVVYTWSVDIDESAHLTGGFHAAKVRGDVYKTLICHNFLGNASSSLIRKECLDHIGGYDRQLKAQKAQGCEDWDLYLRLAEHYEFGVVPEFLVSYRKAGGSMSGNYSQMAKSQQLMLEAIQKKHPEIPNFLYRLSRSSFYLYIAHQCDASGNARATLSWLKKAVKIDPITPFGRLGLHVLLFRNLTKWVLSKRTRLGSDPAFEAIAHNGLAHHVQEELPAEPALSPKSYLEISKTAVWLKVLVGRALHRSLSQV